MLRKTGAAQNTSAAIGGKFSRSRIGYRKAAAKRSADSPQIDCRKSAGANRRPSRASPKLAQCVNVRDFRGKSRTRLIPDI